MAYFKHGELIYEIESLDIGSGSKSLTVTSKNIIVLTGSTISPRSLTLPDATTLTAGRLFRVINTSNVAVTILRHDTTELDTIAPSTIKEFLFTSAGTVNGTVAIVDNTNPILFVEYVTLDSAAITAAQITLTHIPVKANQVVLDVISGSPQIYDDDFVVTGSTLSWSGKSLESFLIVGDKLRVQYYYKSNLIF